MISEILVMMNGIGCIAHIVFRCCYCVVVGGVVLCRNQETHACR